MKKLQRTIVLMFVALALCLAAVACGENTDNTITPPPPTKTYAVTYNLGGGTGTIPQEVDMAAGEIVTLAAATGLTNGNKVFDGWSDGTAKYAAVAQYTMPAHAVTFTAQWKDAVVAKYSVTYNLGGGTGTIPTEADKAEGESFYLAAVTGFSNGNKTFTGWSDGAQAYAMGAQYTMPAHAVTLTALWHDNEIQQPDADGIIEYSGSCALPEKKIGVTTIGGGTLVRLIIDSKNEKAYYKLDGAGWVDGKYFADSSNSNYKPNNYGTDAKYYNIKIATVGYYVLINADGSKLYVCDSDDEPLTNGEFTKVGVAQDPIAKYSVTYDLGGGTGTIPTEADKAEGDKFKLAAATGLTNGDKVFDGWSDGTTKYAAGAQYTMPAHAVTFTAQWKVLQQYTVTYVKPDGVTGEVPAVATVNEGTQITLAANPFEKTGWTFVSWSVTGQTNLKAANAKVTVTQNITITPVFGINYTGSMGGCSVRDNNTIADSEGGIYTFTRSGDIVSLYSDGYLVIVVRVNDSAKTYVVLDDMQNYTVTAANNTVLSFDGAGVAKLGTVATGSYTLSQDGSKINITLGGTTYSDIAMTISGSTLSINVTITIDSTEYVFGSGTTPPPPTQPTSDTFGDYAGEGSASAVVYGYDTAAAATTDGKNLTVQNTSSTDHTFYYARVYKTSNGVNVYIGRTASTQISTSKKSDGNWAQLADGLETLYITNGSYAGQFSIVFSTNSAGKRQITITFTPTAADGQVVTVTWVEKTAA